MTTQEAWLKIISCLKGKTIEFPTVPTTNRTPVWFSASTDGEIILINAAKNKQPSSKITVNRRLKYKTFEKVYPYYLRRSKGEAVSTEVAKITVNQVYYYSLIKHCCEL